MACERRGLDRNGGGRRKHEAMQQRSSSRTPSVRSKFCGQGGIAVLPMDVGYSLIGGSAAALKRIFDTKGRTPSKLNAMLGHDASRAKC